MGRVADPDRGTAPPGRKQGEVIGVEEFLERSDTRDALRELDRDVEGMSALNRLQKDRERAFPRDTTAELGDRRMMRQLPEAGQTRVPLSARQRNARRRDRSTAQATLPSSQVVAQRRLIKNEGHWSSINDQLSDQVGDVLQLSDRDQTTVRRVDKAIQAYEKQNDRGHVIYTNERMPAHINSSNLDGFIRNNFPPGRTVDFDRYTHGTHQLHETAALEDDSGGRVVVFEMQTRRGAYLGGSDKTDNTDHLLPRAMKFEVVDVHHATFTTPDGRSGSRLVVQLKDITPQQ